MNRTLNDLLTGIIDYAGLFPPAALDMQTATDNYAAYYKSDEARWLGRFVVPVARLAEFEQAAQEISPDQRPRENEAWRLTVLAGANLESDVKTIVGFNERLAQSSILVDTIEIKAEHREKIGASMSQLPQFLTPYFEIPIAHDPTEPIKTIADLGARAKVRTGGVKAEDFPSSFNLARFIAICAAEDVPFKATAGLHHPVRSINQLTYEPESATSLMHGFLNLFLAAAFAQTGLRIEQLAELLEERSPAAFQFDADSVIWREQMVVRGQVRNARSLFAISFGSCSFEEPLADLKKIGLL